ncbi:2-hydroxyacyl-CoA dehydratase family protein [Rhodococcoides fascians]|uniref:2-hydroxyacyl-CoA dehydratase family protein n=1 Tax=Rhodococcoides fascians TaxID=1828 RepID=UPI00068F482D|nr:2-hydroxyacyl-CoA dehydratase family protein [Rhodococcus fascians]
MTAPIGDAYDSLFLRAQQAAAEGIPVIGYVGTDTPVELIDSVGALAYRLGSTSNGMSDEAIELLGSAVDSPVLSILSQVLSGELDFMRGLLISRDCQASLRLFYVLRQLRADGRRVPELHLVDLLHLPRESTARYNLAQVNKAAAVLAEWTGYAVTASDVRYAVERREIVRTALLEAQSRRRAEEPTITGTDTLRLHAIAQRSLPEDAVDLIRHSTSIEVPDGRFRLFVTGSGQDDDANYRVLEESGAHIVGEDHSWGDLALDISPSVTVAADLPGLYDALARARQGGGASAQTSGLRDRAEYTRRAIADSGGQAVLSLVRANDPAPDWDYPLIDAVPAARMRGAAHAWTTEELGAVVETLRATTLEESMS